MLNSGFLNAGFRLYQAIASGNEEEVDNLLSLPSIPKFEEIKNTLNVNVMMTAIEMTLLANDNVFSKQVHFQQGGCRQ